MTTRRERGFEESLEASGDDVSAMFDVMLLLEAEMQEHRRD